MQGTSVRVPAYFTKTTISREEVTKTLEEKIKEYDEPTQKWLLENLPRTDYVLNEVPPYVLAVGNYVTTKDLLKKCFAVADAIKNSNDKKNDTLEIDLSEGYIPSVLKSLSTGLPPIPAHVKNLTIRGVCINEVKLSSVDGEPLQLESLTFQQCHVDSVDLSGCRELQELNVVSNRDEEGSGFSLRNVEECTKLAKLTLDCDKFAHDFDLNILQSCPIKELNLRCPKNKNSTELNLKGFEHLKKLEFEFCYWIKTLNLEGCKNITNDSVKSILKKCRPDPESPYIKTGIGTEERDWTLHSVTELKLQGCTLVTDDIQEDIKESHPKIKVSYISHKDYKAKAEEEAEEEKFLEKLLKAPEEFYEYVKTSIKNGSLDHKIFEICTKQHTVLNLSNAGLVDEDVIYLSQFLSKNKTIIELNLSNNSIQGQSTLRLLQSVGNNSSIKKINLSGNEIKFGGAIDHTEWNGFAGTIIYKNTNMYYKLPEALEKNTTLNELDLSNNKIDNAGAPLIMQCVARSSITYFDISKNQISNIECDALLNNKSLQYLNLSRNQLTDARIINQFLATDAAKGIIKKLDLSKNKITSQDLSLNSCEGKEGTFYVIDLSNNDIGPGGLNKISKFMKKNKVVVGLKVSNNKNLLARPRKGETPNPDQIKQNQEKLEKIKDTCSKNRKEMIKTLAPASNALSFANVPPEIADQVSNYFDLDKVSDLAKENELRSLIGMRAVVKNRNTAEDNKEEKKV